MKKAIDWLALVVGLVLAAFGARWMWTGWDIVQAERGWASLIAGSVMLSGGLIVAMLAWTVMRLSAPAVSRREAAPDIVAPEEERAAPPSRPKIPATAVAAGAGAVAVTAAAGAALAAEERPGPPPVAEEPKPDPNVEAPAETPPPLPPVAPPTVGELLRMSEERVVRESHEKHFEEPEALPEVSPAAEEVAPPPAAPALDDDEEPEVAAAIEKVETVTAEIVSTTQVDIEPPAIDEPKADPAADAEPPKPPPLRIPAPTPPPAPAVSDEPVYDDWLERTAREFDRELGRDGLSKDEPGAPEPPPPAPARPEPAVVGRYSSGDTNYLMFADGSIEAQTPEGVMRFASLTELKRFVEKRN